MIENDHEILHWKRVKGVKRYVRFHDSFTLTTRTATREKDSGLCEKGFVCTSLLNRVVSQDSHSQKPMRHVHVAFITDH